MVIQLISSIVKKLVDKPERVTVQEIEATGSPGAEVSADRQGRAVIQVRVAAHDLSRVIGSEGRVFRALRTLVHVMSPDQKDLVVDSAED